MHDRGLVHERVEAAEEFVDRVHRGVFRQDLFKVLAIRRGDHAVDGM